MDEDSASRKMSGSTCWCSKYVSKEGGLLVVSAVLLISFGIAFYEAVKVTRPPRSQTLVFAAVLFLLQTLGLFFAGQALRAKGEAVRTLFPKESHRTVALVELILIYSFGIWLYDMRLFSFYGSSNDEILWVIRFLGEAIPEFLKAVFGLKTI